MRKTVYKLCLALLAFTIFMPAVVFAAPAKQIIPPYPTTFWAYGSLTAPVGAAANFSLAGYRVVLYLKDAQTLKYNGYSYADTDANGQFKINAHGDLQLLPLREGDYFFGVVKKAENANADAKKYGINEEKLPFVQADLTNGYKNVNTIPLPFNLQLVEGEGINDPTVTDGPGTGPGEEEPPAGTVKLSIARHAFNNIKLSWTDPGRVKIYARVGVVGDGAFLPEANGWTKVYDAGAVVPDLVGFGNFQVVADEKALLHNGEVGGGLAEVYYRGVTDDNALATAWAVGKINISVGEGMNVLSFPLEIQDSSIEKVLFSDMLTAGDSIYFKSKPDSANTDKATIVGGVWRDDLGAISPLRITQKYGYWLQASKNRTLTILGDVPRGDAGSTVVTDGGMLIVGVFYPTKGTFASAGFGAGKAANGDSIYFKLLANSANTQKIEFAGGAWTGLVNDLVIRAPLGFWYQRKLGNGVGEFNRTMPTL